MSAPPCQVEDQTDEDFFDKLVDDEDELGGVESDNVKVTHEVEEFGGDEEGVEDESKEVIMDSLDTPSKDILVSEESVSLVSANAAKSNDVAGGGEVATSRGLGAKNIKEVQWTMFNADSAQTGREGSFSEIFSDLGDNEVNPFDSLVDNLKDEPFANVEDNSKVEPFASVEDNLATGFGMTSNITENPTYDSAGSSISTQHQDGQLYPTSTDQATNQQDLYNAQYWENLYPGWRYDSNTGEWIQVEAYGARETTQVNTAQSIGSDFVSGQKSEVSYMQQTAQSSSVVGTLAEGYNNGSVSTWNQSQPGITEYPANMVFDPQYPGWYYDTIAQEWRTLDSYNQAIQSSTGHIQQLQNWSTTNVDFSSQEHNQYGDMDVGKYNSQNFTSQNQGGNAAHSAVNYGQHNMQSWQPETVAKTDAVTGFTASLNSESRASRNFQHGQQDQLMGFKPQRNQQDQHMGFKPQQSQQDQHMGFKPQQSLQDQHMGFKPQQSLHDQPMGFKPQQSQQDQRVGFKPQQTQQDQHMGFKPQHNQQDQHFGFEPIENSYMHEQTNQSHSVNDVATGFRSFVPSENSSKHFHQSVQSQQKLSSHGLYDNQSSGFYSSQPFQIGTQSSNNTNQGRSSAGRPPHALVTFGFGGKLVVMKDCNSFASNSAYGNQGPIGESISVLNITDVVADNNETGQVGPGVNDYFRTLYQQSYPGPLVGGSVGAKEVNRWIDDRITKCETQYADYRKGELLRLLLSLLKIASQNYGKLRSPFGTDPSLKASDRPEKAVAELFSSSRNSQFNGYGAIRCLQNLPSEAQLLATAAEVENLLVSGKRLEALQSAQEGQLWGYALQLAADLGEQFYVDTTKQMAHRMLVAGSPLKTLSLLMAGQPAEVFSVDSHSHSGTPSALNMAQHPAQIGPSGMLDDWQRNLAVITANRTKGDELVILHLGDCLWKERSENIAAHMCYLLSEANFDSFSDSARLCLIGADHWKFPRTYASPEAIQRTEFYEYSMVLGNSQSVLQPFQPYKIIYAYMLAEVGKLSDSLKYCQAILKCLKTNRSPEAEAWKQLLSSLDDRIRAHQQSGFGTNLAPRKLVGKFLPFIDSTIHRMIGPPPHPGTTGKGDTVVPRVANSQSTMAMQSLVPSESTEPISSWASRGNRTSMHNRSISEPDFGRSPRQVDPSKETSPTDAHGKATEPGGPSRFGRFGSTFFQKTIGWVSRSRADRQAKLGEKNKFYYDEKLKRWIEEGAEPSAAEIAPPLPPTSAAFQKGRSDNPSNTLKGENSHANGGSEIKSPRSSERSSGIPPIPPSTNQFSARGRMGVRSRYVDTFNKGGGAAPASFSSPSVATTKPAVGANAKFFIPTPSPSCEQTTDAAGESTQEDTTTTKQDLSTLLSKELSSSPPQLPPISASMQRHPSMSNLTSTGSRGTVIPDNGDESLSARSRRTASWSGSSFPNSFSPPNTSETKPTPVTFGMPSSFVPSNPSTMHMPTNSGSSYGEDLHEVEL